MTIFALTLVLIAAVLHPTWNLLAKRATHGDPVAFVWLTSVLSAAFYAPIVIMLSAVTPTRLHDVRVDLAMMVGTGILHVIYFVLLQRSYRVSDFSLVYPLARGTGPLVTALAAVTLFGERLAALQCAGVAIIIVAIFVIAGGRANASSTHSATRALRRSMWDKQAVSVLLRSAARLRAIRRGNPFVRSKVHASTITRVASLARDCSCDHTRAIYARRACARISLSSTIAVPKSRRCLCASGQSWQEDSPLRRVEAVTCSLQMTIA